MMLTPSRPTREVVREPTREAVRRHLMLIRDLDIRIIAEDSGQLIKNLTLDPRRDYQPQDPKV